MLRHKLMHLLLASQKHNVIKSAAIIIYIYICIYIDILINIKITRPLRNFFKKIW